VKWVVAVAFVMDRTTYHNELDTKLEGKKLLLDDMFSD
jgi:hypothetical protein